MQSRFRALNAFNSCCLFDVGGSCIFLAELPVLDNEMFHSIKPGLSAYANAPEMVSSFSTLINYTELEEKVQRLYIVDTKPFCRELHF